ncbi:MAG: N-6 DNA methylase, partial [Candidatus Binatia bacterium]
MLDYINDTILPRLVDKYNHSGDVFQNKLLIKTPETLEKIVKKLSKLTLLDTDSDIKGDAFEYFLKNSISVGNDLGEYFTPRHIVKLMVDLVDPKYGETVYDPACGTGGFLISAFRHIKTKVRETRESIKILKEDTIWGRELTGTAKIAKMNMIIIGDGHTNIEQMDSLKKPVKGEFDVVLTNYPFSQTTDYSAYYGLDTESANPVFLKHVIDALKVGGRAGVVVPEGMLFDESQQYAKVRRILLEGCDVEAIINLSSFVFRPYTGQPTSILIFKKGSQTKKVWFFEVKEDGFEKSSRKHGRRAISQSDLPLLRQCWNDKANSDRSFSVDFKTIAEHDYKLTIDEYRKTHDKVGWVPLGGSNGICDIIIGGTPSRKVRRYFIGPHPWVKISDMTKSNGMYITATEETLSDAGIANSNVKLIPKDTLLLSFKLSIGKVAMTGRDVYTNEAIAALVPKDKRVLPQYLYYILPRLNLSGEGGRQAAKGQTSSKGRLEKILVPVPPIPVQTEIVREMLKRDAEIQKHRENIRQIEAEGTAILERQINKGT